MWRGMAIPALCLGMAGCGAEQAARDVKEAVDPVAEAAEKTVASGGARLAGDVTMRLPEGELPMVLSGAASFEEDRVAIELDFPGRIPGLSQARTDRAREEAGFPLRQVSDGDVAYMSDGTIREKGAKEGIVWVRVDLGEIDGEAGTDLANFSQISEANPEKMLQFRRVAGDAREVGTETIDGARTTKWRADLDLARYPDTVAEEDREAAQRTVDLLRREWGSTKQPTTVWIDDRGLIRRERLRLPMVIEGESVTAIMVLDLLDVGEPVDVALPDENQVYDVTDEAADQVDGAQGDES